ncbi:hypothetical protein DXG03_006645 [Asterophora parasitica]|uniref:Uncharacterized protein n=1 Tax=Asterophora parasitica TaxID=117018 RepID=A0A9P7GAM0_9AGAR|nr:hypothetical protein DXG03_006645 [Asterophora parasitica]
MVKAVHLYSREYDVIRLLSTLRDDPMNHTIPVLDFVEVEKDDIVFIVMEEWSSQLLADPPCCLRIFLAALRQCIEITTAIMLISTSKPAESILGHPTLLFAAIEGRKFHLNASGGSLLILTKSMCGRWPF